MYRTVARNTGKRKERRAVDARHDDGAGSRASARSPSRRTTSYGTMPLEEAVTKNGVLYDHHQGDEPKRFGDDRSLIKAMKSATGPRPSGWTSTGSSRSSATPRIRKARPIATT
jgi:hypothetical protein